MAIIVEENNMLKCIMLNNILVYANYLLGGLPMEFCECGSIKINGSCSNRKCKNHVEKFEQITVKQIAVIKHLFEMLERDYKETDIKKLSKDEAQNMVEDLEAELEELLAKKERAEEYDFIPEELVDIEQDEEDNEDE